MRRPLVWSVVQQFGRQAVNYVIFALVAARLRPDELGLMGVALIWMTLAAVFADLGFSVALVQRDEMTSAHLSTAFFLNFALGLALCAVGALIAWPLQGLTGVIGLGPVVSVLSVTFVTDALALTQIALAQRNLRFRDLAVRDIGAALVGGCFGVALAFAGAGVWSLVAQTVATSVTQLVLIWSLSPWRPQRAAVSRAAAADLWGYGSRIFAYNLFKYAAQNSDRILVGALLGTTALGLYTFAYKIVLFPVANLSNAVGAYLFPRLARLQYDPAAARAVYLSTVRMVNALVLPAMALLIVVAPFAVPLIFGDVWAASVPVVQAFTIVAVLQALISPAGQLMKALNRPAWLLNWSIGFTLLVMVCLGLGSRWGISGVALGLLAAHLIGLLVIVVINRRLAAIGAGALVAALLPAVAAAAAMGAILWLVVGVSGSPGPWSGLAIVAASGAYVAILALIDRPLVATLLKGPNNA